MVDSNKTVHYSRLFGGESQVVESVEQNGLKAEPKLLPTERRGLRLCVGSNLGAAFSFVEHV